MPRHMKDRSAHDLLQALAFTPEFTCKERGLVSRDDFSACALNMSLSEARPAPEIDATTIGGRCNLWCVPHLQRDTKACLGQMQRRGVVNDLARNAPPRSPSTSSDID